MPEPLLKIKFRRIASPVPLSTSIESSVLNAIVLPAPVVVPPIVLPETSSTSMPTALGLARVPVESVPILLPATTLLVVPSSAMSTPSPLFSEMTLPAPAVVPPIVLPDAALSISTPVPFAMETSPVTSVPMSLPATRFPVVLPLEISTPSFVLPEMTFPAPLVMPPIVLLCAPRLTSTPTPLGRASVPVMSVPIRFPSTTMPVLPNLPR